MRPGTSRCVQVPENDLDVYIYYEIGNNQPYVQGVQVKSSYIIL